MAANTFPQKLNLRQFADRYRNEMVPLSNRFCYFCASAALSPEDLREYLDEPVAALPPVVAARLPEIRILLVPYLEAGDKPKTPASLLVASEKPLETLSQPFGSVLSPHGAVFAFAVKDTEVADYHYRLYHAIAQLLTGRNGSDVPADYIDTLRQELAAKANGEVDELSWRLKLDLDDKDRAPGRPTPRFRKYYTQSFLDTLTLYLHGICCDIDVETGPRQLPSNLLRRRLNLLKKAFPPPPGYAVLPEDL